MFNEVKARKLFKEAKMVQQPVAVIVFGTDCELKTMAYKMCRKSFRHMVEVTGKRTTWQERVRLSVHSDKDVVMVMSGEESADPFLRKESVRLLRFLGAKTIVGVFAKKKHLTKAEKQSPSKTRILEKQMHALNEAQPPVPADFDVFITIEEN